jgi:hypothetical protein
MAIEVVNVEIVRRGGLIITFSDGTYANYGAEELIDLRPRREIDQKLQRAMQMK